MGEGKKGRGLGADSSHCSVSSTQDPPPHPSPSASFHPSSQSVSPLTCALGILSLPSPNIVSPTLLTSRFPDPRLFPEVTTPRQPCQVLALRSQKSPLSRLMQSLHAFHLAQPAQPCIHLPVTDGYFCSCSLLDGEQRMEWG